MFFSYKCLFCCQATTSDMPICKWCIHWLPWNKKACNICGYPVTTKLGMCSECKVGDWAFDQSLVPFIYSHPINKLIHQFKFAQKIKYINVLFKSIDSRLVHLWNARLLIKPDLLFPVPISINKLKTRGFNQSVIIAQRLSQLFSIAIDSESVTKTNHTVEQKNIAKAQRLANLKDTFVVKRNLKNLKIMIVDDIMTTGSTVHTLAKVLKQYGASYVSVFALARTIK